MNRSGNVKGQDKYILSVGANRNHVELELEAPADYHVTLKHESARLCGKEPKADGYPQRCFVFSISNYIRLLVVLLVD